MARPVQGGFSTPVSIESIDLAGGAGARIPTDANLQVGDVDVAGGNPVPVDIVAYIPVETIRDSVTFTATIGAGANLSDVIAMANFSGGNVYIPAAWTAADIGFHVATASGGTFVPLYDDNGNLVQTTVGAVTDRACAFPPEIFACRFIKLWSQNAGVNANQVAERDLDYELKS